MKGGTVTGNPTGYTIESASITLNNPTRTNYQFEGWTGTGLTGLANTVTIPAHSTGNRSYSANWTQAHSEFSVELNGGVFDDENPATYDPETNTYRLKTPTRKGYKFLGWNLEGEDDISLNVEIPKGSDENRKYIANWELVEYSLTYKLNGGTVSPDNPASYTIESDDFTLTNPERMYCVFRGWRFGDEILFDVTIPKGSTGNREYTAIWEGIPFTISYDLNGGTLSQKNPVTYDVTSDDFTLNNPTMTHYDFAGWTGTGLTEASTEVVIPTGSIGDREYTANFTPTVYTITYNLDGGTVAGNPTSYTIETSTFTLSNPTKDGYTFAGWTGTGLEEITAEVTIIQNSTGDREYTANYLKGNPYLYTGDVTPGDPNGSGHSYTRLSDLISDMTLEERLVVKILKVDDKIKDLSGLEAFTNLETLDLTEAYSLEKVDLSGNKQISEVNISGNPAVQSLNLSGSSIETLDASGCDNLTQLDVSGCEDLKTLDVNSTNLTNLNVEGCVNLEELDCSDNKLNELHVSSCVALVRLDCSSNNLYRLDVGRLANLAELKCDNQARQLWNVGQSQAIHFLDFFHDDGVNGTGIENITNVQFKIRKTGEILPGGYSEYYLYDGIVWFSVPLSGVITREDYPPEIYYDYVTGFQKAGSSSVSSAASESVMSVTIENTLEVPTSSTSSSTSEEVCNAGMTFPMLALVALLLIRKR